MSNYTRLAFSAQTAVGPMLWGTNYWIATELLPPGRPLLAATGRALPAGLLLVALTRRLPPRGWRLRIAALAVLNVGLFFVLLFVAAERLPGGVAAAAGAIAPIVVILLGWPLLAVAPTRTGLGLGVLGVAGVAALVLGPAASLDPIGVAAAVGSAACMATGTVLGRRFGRPPISLASLTAWQLVVGGSLVAPLSLLVEGVPAVPTDRNVVGFALVGLLGTALAHALWFRGVTVLPAAAISFLALLSPLVATAIGWLALGQSLSPVQLGGAALIVIAVLSGQRAGGVPPRSARVGDAREQSAGGRVEARDIAARTRDEHRPLEAAQDQPRAVDGRAVEADGALALSACEDGGKPRLVVVEEPRHGRAHRRGEGLVLGREDPAEAHALALQHPAIERDVRLEPCDRRQLARVDLVERGGEALDVARDQRLAERGLAREVVVQARLRDGELERDVRVAEAVEAAGLHEPLGHLEDARRRVRLMPRSRGRHPRILSQCRPLLTIYLLVGKTRSSARACNLCHDAQGG
jgi:probable blue pigment (indigoidine) exporter